MWYVWLSLQKHSASKEQIEVIKNAQEVFFLFCCHIFIHHVFSLNVKQLIPNPPSIWQGDNARPLQALNGRIIYEHE